MRYKSSTGSVVTVTTDDGKIATVGTEFGELDEPFHASATSQGCIAETPPASHASAARQQKQQQHATAGVGHNQRPTSAGRATTKGKKSKSR